MSAYAHSIGDLAEKTGCKVQTIRYYENIGLLAPAIRTAGNQRRYQSADVDRLAFIRHSRELGFPLDQIRELLSLNDDPDQPCQQVHDLASNHLSDVEQRINSLAALRDELKAMVKRCKSGHTGGCRVIEALADHSHAHCLSNHHARENDSPTQIKSPLT